MAKNAYLSINLIPMDKMKPKRNPQFLFGLILMFISHFSSFLLTKIKDLIPIKVSVKYVIILPNIIETVIHVI